MGQSLQTFAFLPALATKRYRVKQSKEFLKLRPYEKALQTGVDGNSSIKRINDSVYYVTARKPMQAFAPLSSQIGYVGAVMTILKHGEELTLVNAQRIRQKELDKLDQLGEVKHIVRLGAHASGEPFYIERYPDAEYWLLEGAERYEPCAKEINTLSENASSLPIPGMKVFEMAESMIAEAQIYVPNEDGGVLVSCDALQHHENFPMPQSSVPVSLFFYFRGIFGVARVSPVVVDFGYEAHGIKSKKIVSDHFAKVLENEFEVLAAGHGKPIFKDASRVVRSSLRKQRFLA